MSTTRVGRYIHASPEVVYRALLEPNAIQQWQVPDGMTSQVHQLSAREGGAFRISLTYGSASASGKTSAHTDTSSGHFLELRPNERVVQQLACETTDPTMAGAMTVTYSLVAHDGGTELTAVHEGVPAGVPVEDNETGWRMALDKLARLVERTTG